MQRSIIVVVFVVVVHSSSSIDESKKYIIFFRMTLTYGCNLIHNEVINTTSKQQLFTHTKDKAQLYVCMYY